MRLEGEPERIDLTPVEFVPVRRFEEHINRFNQHIEREEDHWRRLTRFGEILIWVILALTTSVIVSLFR